MRYLIVLFLFLACTNTNRKTANVIISDSGSLHQDTTLIDSLEAPGSYDKGDLSATALSRNIDTAAITEKFIQLFEKKHKKLLEEFISFALAAERSYWYEDFIDYMETLIEHTQKPDALLFFLAESFDCVVRTSPDEEWVRRDKWREILGDLSFRTQAVRYIHNPDGGDKGEFNDYSFQKDEKESSLFMDRSPDMSHSWTITYTARILPNEMVANIATNAEDRYGKYPAMLFIRFKNKKILYTTPQPNFDDFYKNPGSNPEKNSIPDIKSSDEEGDEIELTDPILDILFEEITEDNSLIKACLFQTNRDAYFPAVNFVPECYLVYQWNGKKYEVKEKICD